MSYLLDTSVLGRLANTKDVDYLVAVRAAIQLHRLGEVVHLTAQNLIEFRNFATRPTKLNGLGYSVQVTEFKASQFESAFSLLPETPDIFPAWKSLVAAAGITGKQVHDARLVAICHLYGVKNLLTFNVQHFMRLSGFGPGIMVVDPATV